MLPTSTSISTSMMVWHRHRYLKVMVSVTPFQAAPRPTGTVTLYGPNGIPQQQVLVNGAATFQLPVRGRPRGSISAIYSGDTIFAASQSPVDSLGPQRPMRRHR